jgi:hypothetical protein
MERAPGWGLWRWWRKVTLRENSSSAGQKQWNPISESAIEKMLSGEEDEGPNPE